MFKLCLSDKTWKDTAETVNAKLDMSHNKIGPAGPNMR